MLLRPSVRMDCEIERGKFSNCDMQYLVSCHQELWSARSSFNEAVFSPSLSAPLWLLETPLLMRTEQRMVSIRCLPEW